MLFALFHWPPPCASWGADAPTLTSMFTIDACHRSPPSMQLFAGILLLSLRVYTRCRHFCWQRVPGYSMLAFVPSALPRGPMCPGVSSMCRTAPALGHTRSVCVCVPRLAGVTHSLWVYFYSDRTAPSGILGRGYVVSRVRLSLLPSPRSRTTDNPFISYRLLFIRICMYIHIRVYLYLLPVYVLRKPRHRYYTILSHT